MHELSPGDYAIFARHGRPGTTCGRLSRQAHANATQEFDAARVVTLLKYAKRLEPAVADEDS